MREAKTIQIFIPDGNPRSIKITEVTNRIIQAVLIPRNKLKEASRRKEIKNVGIYFLFSDIEDKVKTSVYIGEAEKCYKRLKQQNKSKEFWNVAIVISSRTNTFTKTEGKYLEWYFCKKAEESKRFELENSAIPSEPHISEPKKADLIDNFKTVKLLLSTLGYPVFDKIKKPKEREMLICKGKKAYAEGEYIEDGLVVFEGSKANLEETRTAGKFVKNAREKLIDKDILKKEKNVYIFTSDYIFPAPSTAAAVVLGRRANGWTEWKNKRGKTLDELKRK